MRRPFRAIGLDSFILYGIEWETAFVSASSYILAPLKSSLRTIDNRRNSGKGGGSVWIRYLGVGQRFRLWNSSLPIPLPPLLNQSETRSLTEISLLIPLMTYRFRQLIPSYNFQDIYKSFSSLSFFFPRVFGKMTRTFKNLKRKKLESRKNWEIFV